MPAAIEHYTRVASVAPQSPVRATAQYDAAAAMLAMKDWDGAARLLEDFRSRYPKHPLQEDVSAKLAVAYVEKGNWAQAAGEFERLAAANKDPQLARAGLWQAAEMYEKAGARAPAARAYERYVKQYPEPLEPALEARYRLARVAREDGNAARELALMKEVQRADQTGGCRTHRPNPLPRRHGHAGAGAAAGRRLPQGRAGRAAEASAEAQERQDGAGAESVCDGRRLRHRRSVDGRDVPRPPSCIATSARR